MPVLAFSAIRGRILEGRNRSRRPNGRSIPQKVPCFWFTHASGQQSCQNSAALSVAALFHSLLNALLNALFQPLLDALLQPFLEPAAEQRPFCPHHIPITVVGFQLYTVESSFGG